MEQTPRDEATLQWLIDLDETPPLADQLLQGDLDLAFDAVGVMEAGLEGLAELVLPDTYPPRFDSLFVPAVITSRDQDRSKRHDDHKLAAEVGSFFVNYAHLVRHGAGPAIYEAERALTAARNGPARLVHRAGSCMASLLVDLCCEVADGLSLMPKLKQLRALARSHARVAAPTQPKHREWEVRWLFKLKSEPGFGEAISGIPFSDLRDWLGYTLEGYNQESTRGEVDVEFCRATALRLYLTRERGKAASSSLSHTPNLETLAMALLTDNPGLTLEEVATNLGCHPKSLTAKRMPKLAALRRSLQNEPLRGFRHRGGDVDAYG